MAVSTGVVERASPSAEERGEHYVAVDSERATPFGDSAAQRDWKKIGRIAVKLLLAFGLLLILMLFSSGEVDFVYKGF